jgi:hypothetical protein
MVCGDIIGQHHVQLAGNQLTCSNGVQPGMLCQDFLAHIHPHIDTLLMAVRFFMSDSNKSLPFWEGFYYLLYSVIR